MEPTPSAYLLHFQYIRSTVGSFSVIKPQPRGNFHFEKSLKNSMANLVRLMILTTLPQAQVVETKYSGLWKQSPPKQAGRYKDTWEEH